MLSQLSTQAGSSDSALFPDHVPIEPWDVQPVTAAESSSPTTLHLPTQEFVACLTRLDQKIQSLEGLMNPLALQIMAIEQKINLLVEAMADEQDEDDEPQRYMDGSRV